jgi:hypothetical protein
MSYESWLMSYELWVMDYELWLWVMSYDFWLMTYDFYDLRPYEPLINLSLLFFQVVSFFLTFFMFCNINEYCDWWIKTEFTCNLLFHMSVVQCKQAQSILRSWDKTYYLPLGKNDIFNYFFNFFKTSRYPNFAFGRPWVSILYMVRPCHVM